MNATTTELATLVDQHLGARTDLTPYELAGVASKVRGTYVREQMLYQYVAKGFIKSTTGVRATKQGVRQVKVVLRADARAWLLKYLASKV